MSTLGPIGQVLRSCAVLLLVVASETETQAQATDNAINQIIQAPAPFSGGFQASPGISRAKPSAPAARAIEAGVPQDVEVNAVIRALSPREVAPPTVLTLASTTFIFETDD